MSEEFSRFLKECHSFLYEESYFFQHQLDQAQSDQQKAFLEPILNDFLNAAEQLETFQESFDRAGALNALSNEELEVLDSAVRSLQNIVITIADGLGSRALTKQFPEARRHAPPRLERSQITFYAAISRRTTGFISALSSGLQSQDTPGADDYDSRYLPRADFLELSGRNPDREHRKRGRVISFPNCTPRSFSPS